MLQYKFSFSDLLICDNMARDCTLTEYYLKSKLEPLLLVRIPKGILYFYRLRVSQSVVKIQKAKSSDVKGVQGGPVPTLGLYRRRSWA